MAKTYKTGLVITGDGKGGVRAIQANEQALDKLDKQQRRNRKGATAMATAYDHVRRNATRYAASVGLAAAGVVTLATRQANAVREADSLANAMGVSTGELQAFGYAAEQAGLGADKAGDIVKDLQDKIGDAALTGGGEMAEVLDKIGISAERLQQMGPTDQLLAISEAIEGLPKAQQINILESVADDASRLLPLLRNNGELFREFSQEARDFNIALGDDDVERMLAVNRATQRFSGAMRGLGNDITLAVAPALTDSIDDMDYLRGIVGDAGFQQNLATMASAFATTAGFLAEGMSEYVTLGDQIGTAAANLAGYSNELEDIDRKIQRLKSMRNSSWMSRTGLFDFGNGFDAYLDNGDIDAAIRDLQSRRQDLIGDAVSGGSDNPATDSLKTIEATGSKYEPLLGEYDKRHEKLVKLREDRRKLNAAIEADPANADGYRRSLAEVNRQIESLGTQSRSTASELSSAYSNMEERLAEQVAMFGETGEAARIRYEIEQGSLQGLSAARRENLLAMARELDQMEAQKTQAEELEQVRRDLATPEQQATATLDQRLGVIQDIDDPEEKARLSAAAWDAYTGEATEDMDRMSAFANRAAENIQDQLGDTMSQTLAGDFDGILDSWSQMLRDMAAQAAAQNLATALLGDSFGDNGEIGGLLGTAGSAIGSMLGGGTSSASVGTSFADAGIASAGAPSGFTIPGLAKGGPAGPGSIHEVAENGPELLNSGGRSYLLMGREGGHVTPAGTASAGGRASGSVYVNITNSGEPVQEKSRRTRRDGNGDQVIDIEVEKSLNRMASDGRLDSALQPYASRNGRI